MKEDRVNQPTSFDLISKHQLTSPSSIKRTLKFLLEKEMVVELIENDKKYYSVYDVFLARWMQRKSF